MVITRWLSSIAKTIHLNDHPVLVVCMERACVELARSTCAKRMAVIRRRKISLRIAIRCMVMNSKVKAVAITNKGMRIEL